MSRLTLKQTKINPEAAATDDVENYDQTVDQAAEQAESAPSAPQKAVEPRKRASAGKESTEAPKAPQNATQGRTAAKKSNTTAAKKPAAATKAAPKRKKSEPVKVLAARTTRDETGKSEAERVTIYLHPDDYEYLKYEFPAGINDTLRTLVALMRHDERLRARVERVVRTAPRGSQHGKTK